MSVVEGKLHAVPRDLRVVHCGRCGHVAALDEDEQAPPSDVTCARRVNALDGSTRCGGRLSVAFYDQRSDASPARAAPPLSIVRHELLDIVTRARAIDERGKVPVSVELLERVDALDEGSTPVHEALRTMISIVEALQKAPMGVFRPTNEALDAVTHAKRALKQRDEEVAQLKAKMLALDEASFAAAHRCVECGGAVLPADQTPAGYLCRHCGPASDDAHTAEVERLTRERDTARVDAKADQQQWLRDLAHVCAERDDARAEVARFCGVVDALTKARAAWNADPNTDSDVANTRFVSAILGIIDSASATMAEDLKRREHRAWKGGVHDPRREGGS